MPKVILLNVHTQLISGASCLFFYLSGYLLQYFVCATREGSDKTALSLHWSPMQYLLKFHVGPYVNCIALGMARVWVVLSAQECSEFVFS